MAFNITSSPTSTEILANLLGDTTGLSNIQITTAGNPLAVGLFQESPLNIRSGIVLSTGRADQLVGANTSDQNNISTVLNSLDTANSSDATTFEITFNADAVDRQLFLQYVFGSEEFLDFAGNSFNDRITLELNGVNLATLNNGNPVDVNSLTPNSSTFSTDYVNNLNETNPAYSQTTLDGYTVPLTFRGNLLPNASNRLIITIQDIGDGAVDSALFLAAGSVGVSDPRIPTINVATGSDNISARTSLNNDVDEDGANGIFYTFTRTGATNQALSVNYQLGGTATFDTDYSSPGFPTQSGTINFAPGSASETLLVFPRTDVLVEGDETVVVNLLPANNAEYIVGAGSAAGTILDEDTPLNSVSVTISPATTTENASTSGNLVYTFTRTGSTVESLRVDFNLVGTALISDDYDIRSTSSFQGSFGSVVFSAGSDTANLVIDPRSDAIIESLETVELTLTPRRFDPQADGGSRSYIVNTPNVVTGNIVDSPPIPPSISLFVDPNTVGENDQANLSYIFTRTGSTTLPLTIQYLVGGTASLATDYTVSGAASFDDTIGSVTFQAGASDAVVEIAPTPDANLEQDETVFLQLDSIAGGIGGYNITTFQQVVGTIVDAATPALPTVDIFVEPQNVAEGGQTNLTYTFFRSGSTANELTVNYNISGTAEFAADYSQIGASNFTGTTGSITFAAGSNAATLAIAATTDAVMEPDETVLLTLANSPSYVVGGNSAVTGTIVDVPVVEPPAISLSLNRISVNESGTANLSYTFTRTGSTEERLVVSYQLAGTAFEDGDYSTLGTSGSSRTVDFAVGASTFTIRVDPTPDILIEGNETVSLALLPATNAEYTVVDSTPVVGTIIDASLALPVINVTLTPTSVNEDGIENLIYTFTRSGASSTQSLSVNYQIGGTASFDADYLQTGASSFTANAGTITFAENSNTAVLSLTPVSDNVLESDETVNLTLLPGSGYGNPDYIVGTPEAIEGIIIDATPVVSVVLEPSIAVEGGTNGLVYIFSRTGSTAQPLVINYNIGGTATFAADYNQTGASSFTDTTGSITFAADAETATLIITPALDTIADPDEIVTLSLVGNSTYSIGSNSAASGTITDVPPVIVVTPPTINLTVSPISVSENGTANLAYTFTRSGSTGNSLTVSYRVDGTANSGNDYTISSLLTAATATVTFNVGADTATVFVNPNPDTLVETDETVTLSLIGSEQYTSGVSSIATGTIVDVPPIVVVTPPSISLTVNPASVAEDGTENLVYTFIRTGSTIESLLVDYDFGGGAAFGNDYTVIGANSLSSLSSSGVVTLNIGTVNFAAGSETATVIVDPTADAIAETDESVTLRLAASPNDSIPGGTLRYNIATPDAIEGIIIDATPVVSVVLEPSIAVEGGTNGLVYIFSRTGSTAQPLVINYNIGGTATFAADYNQIGASSFTNTTGSITFAADAETATLTITPALDTIADPDEIVTLSLVGNSTYSIGSNSAASGTITDVPPVIVVTPPTINLAISPISVSENGTTNLAYTFTRSGSTGNSLTVSYRVDGTTDSGNDYTISSLLTAATATVTFDVGADTATVFVSPNSDTLVETDETVILTLIGSEQYTSGVSSTATGTITDVLPIGIVTPPSISLTVNPTSVAEDGTEGLVYTFTRSGALNAQPLSVNYQIGGTASFGADYQQAGAASFVVNAGTITFGANSDTATLTLTPISDNVLESNETVDLTLLGAGYGDSDYVISTSGTLTGTIIEPVIAVTNLPPTAIIFNGNVSNNRFFIAENTATPIRLADITITDDQLGVNTISLSGADANSFELIGTALFLRSGIALDFETRTTYDLVVTVDDTAVGTTPDVTSNFTLIVTDINEPPTGTPVILIGNATPNTPIRILRSTFLTGFSDVENNPLNVVNPVASNGTVINNNDGTFTLTPTADFSGQIDIIYGVTDGVNILAGQQRSVIVPSLPNGLNFIGTTNLDVGAVNSFTNGIFAVNPNNINLVGDEINLLGGVNSVTVPGKIITLQPDRPSQAIQIGSTDSNSANILDLVAADLAAIADGFSQIIIGRTSGTGNIEIGSGVTFRDPVLLRSPGGQLSVFAPITLADNATLDFNVQSLVKSGISTLTIDGNTPTTSIDSVIINGGILLLAKASNTEALSNAPIAVNSGVLQLGNQEQISNLADLTLNSGTFNLNGFNETLDRLQITSNSTINFGNGSSKLAFSNSSSANWTGVLFIENWSDGESIRFGNGASGLTLAQLNNIQFVGFGRGANINTSGFITPIGSTVVNPAPDQDGVSDDIEDLAANEGDGNLDGIRDSLQENVVSILNLGKTSADSIVTIIAQAGAKISGLRSLANPITAVNLTSLANPIEFKITGLANGASTTVEYLIAKADQNRQYNTYVMFGATADNPTPHAYEFLFDGQTGAELFDTNGDGLTDKAILHFVDGLRGDSDLAVNGEIQDPGAPGVASAAVGLSLDPNNVVRVSGAAGAAIASFSLAANRTGQVSEVGFFKIDGANAVEGVATNAATFARTALQSGQVIFSSLADDLLSTADISRQLQLSAGDRLGFYLIRNGTVDAALQRNDFSNVLFSLNQANPSGRSALEVTTTGENSYQLKWEQGNVGVNDDLILNLQLQNDPLNNQNLAASIQGGRESELLDLSSFTGRDVQVNFTVQREAAFNNTVGFYKVEDAQGTVTSITGAKIKPGEAGYQATVVQNRIAGIDLAVANGQTASIDAVLRGGAIYAPFLIANASPDTLSGNFSNVYTSYALGNADTADHLRLLGDNTFGFEDLVGAGDRDFNDVVIKAIITNRQ